MTKKFLDMLSVIAPITEQFSDDDLNGGTNGHLPRRVFFGTWYDNGL